MIEIREERKAAKNEVLRFPGDSICECLLMRAQVSKGTDQDSCAGAGSQGSCSACRIESRLSGRRFPQNSRQPPRAAGIQPYPETVSNLVHKLAGLKGTGLQFSYFRVALFNQRSNCVSARNLFKDRTIHLSIP